MKKLPVCQICGKNCHSNNKLSVHDKCLPEWKRREKERKKREKIAKENIQKEMDKQRKKERKERDKVRTGHLCCVCNMPLGGNNKSGYCTAHYNMCPDRKKSKKNYRRPYYH